MDGILRWRLRSIAATYAFASGGSPSASSVICCASVQLGSQRRFHRRPELCRKLRTAPACRTANEGHSVWRTLLFSLRGDLSGAATIFPNPAHKRRSDRPFSILEQSESRVLPYRLTESLGCRFSSGKS